MRSEIAEKILSKTSQETNKYIMENKSYWKILSAEYNIPIFKGREQEWFEQDQKQSKELISKYGELSLILNDFANALRAEKISESFFRQLCRYLLDKNFK